MNKKIIVKLIAFVVLGVFTLVSKKGSQNFSDGFFQTFDKKTDQSDIVLTKHAKCRMQCREIRIEEIQDALQNGRVNQRKSNSNAKPCPIKAFEKKSLDGPKIRVVAAKCQEVTKIVTVIDLDNSYDCYCK